VSEVCDRQRKSSISSGEMLNGPVIILVSVWCKSIHFWRRYSWIHFCAQWPWHLTFIPQICCPNYCCPALCFH